jgi:hypothetical protein
MAKLPYTYTICPPGPEPKQFTASCTEMGALLKSSPDGNLTINQRRKAVWDAWSGNHMGAVEEFLHAWCEQNRKERGK